jgi:hypothetical protein
MRKGQERVAEPWPENKYKPSLTAFNSRHFGCFEKSTELRSENGPVKN